MKATIEVEVLTYDELPADYKTKLLHQEFECIREMWQYDHLTDEFTAELSEIGFEESKIWFSGFGNQGDGACFDATVDLVKVCKHLGIAYNPDEQDWECSIEVVNHHYNHARTRRIVFNATAPGLLLRDTQELVDSVGDRIEELRLKLSKDFYRRLEDDADGCTSEESLLESLRSRSYAFGRPIAEALAKAADLEFYSRVEII